MPLSSRRRYRRPLWLCVVSPSPATIELTRPLLASLALGALWSTASLREARRWLDAHSECRLLVIETSLPSGGLQLCFTDPAHPLGASTVLLALPAVSSQILAAARKIYSPKCPTPC